MNPVQLLTELLRTAMNVDNFKKKSLFYLLISILCFIFALSFEDNFEHTSNFLKVLSFGLSFAALYYNLKIEE